MIRERTMKKQRERFYICRHTLQVYDESRIVEHQEFVGETFAVSEAQAVNFYKYRTGAKNSYCDEGGSRYYRETKYRAFPANKIIDVSKLNYHKDTDY